MTRNHDQVHATYPEQTSQVHIFLLPFILSVRLHSRLYAEDKVLPLRTALWSLKSHFWSLGSDVALSGGVVQPS